MRQNRKVRKGKRLRGSYVSEPVEASTGCREERVVQLVAYGGSVYGIGRMQCGSEGVRLLLVGGVEKWVGRKSA